MKIYTMGCVRRITGENLGFAYPPKVAVEMKFQERIKLGSDIRRNRGRKLIKTLHAY